MSDETPKYRIIYHEVGHALQYMDFPITPENMLRKAVLPLARTQVDCLSWLGHTYLGGPYDMPRMWRDYLDPSPYEYIDAQGRPMGLFMEKIRPGHDLYHDEGQRRRYGTVHELWKQGADVVDLAAECARARGMDFYLAFRLNDFHHGTWEEHPRWWLDHKEMTVGKGEGLEVGNHATRPLASLDFTYPEVHEHMMAPMLAGAACYDVDGVEIDFTRCPPYFPTGQEQPELLTAFLRELRTRLAPIFAEKGRPVRIMAHVPHPGACADIGLNWAAWMREGLVDHLASGGWQFNGYHNDLRPLVAAARDASTRVYVAYDSINYDYNHTARYGRIEYLRAACLNYYHQGVDGVLFFNDSGHWLKVYPGPAAAAYPHLLEVGDPDCIERRDKIYALGWGCVEDWHLVWSSDKPDERTGVEMTFQVSDALQESANCGDLERVRLRMAFQLRTPWINELNAWHSIWSRLDRVEFLLNGEPIVPQAVARDAVVTNPTTGEEVYRNWTRHMTFELTYGPLPRYGMNALTVRMLEPDPQLTGPRELWLGPVEVEVRYVKPGDYLG